MNVDLHAARVFMGDSLGFHILFVIFGLTLPVLIVWFEFLANKNNDARYLKTAKFWSKVMTLLVVTGVLSGTIIALQMSLVWPGILLFGGSVIGLPFMFETYAFLIEATFLALYMSTWGKVNKWLHWFFGIMIVIGSAASAYAITSINGWMNNPTGFDYIDGKIVNPDVAAAMFSTPALVTFFHSMPGYYLAGTLFIAGLYAFRLSRAKKSELGTNKYKFDYMILNKLIIFVTILFVLSAITADITGKYLAKHEPTKLAALELNYETRTNAPLTLGGVGSADGTINAPHIEIPSGLSILACNTATCEIQGINDTPQDERPPLYIHTFFDIKLTLIAILLCSLAAYFAVKRWKPKLLKSKLLLTIFVGISWIGLAIVELGWMITEIGRQPWAVRGYVTTEEALTKTHNVSTFGYLFPLAYLLLFVVTYMALRRIIQNEKKSKDGAL